MKSYDIHIDYKCIWLDSFKQMCNAQNMDNIKI